MPWIVPVLRRPWPTRRGVPGTPLVPTVRTRRLLRKGRRQKLFARIEKGCDRCKSVARRE
eukprot:3560967-Lingulodinium_polyedra.AAC.1